MSNTMIFNSLKRLYKQNREANWEANDVTNERLQSMIPKVISQEDYEEIVNQ